LPCYVCTCVIVHSLVSLILRHPRLSLFPYTTLFRSRAASVRSIAVCYLFSYANPSHEERTRAIIRDVFPEAHVSLSSEVLPRIRSEEHTSELQSRENLVCRLLLEKKNQAWWR